jgi:hypothetical protein
VGGSLWAQRKVRRSAARYLPDQVASAARARVERTADDLRAAIGEGRAAMVEREAELRARLPRDPRALPPGHGEVIEARSFDQRDRVVANARGPEAGRGISRGPIGPAAPPGGTHKLLGEAAPE